MGFRSQNNYDDDMDRAYRANTPAHIRWLRSAAIFTVLIAGFLIFALAMSRR